MSSCFGFSSQLERMRSRGDTVGRLGVGGIPLSDGWIQSYEISISIDFNHTFGGKNIHLPAQFGVKTSENQ